MCVCVRTGRCPRCGRGSRGEGAEKERLLVVGELVDHEVEGGDGGALIVEVREGVLEVRGRDSSVRARHDRLLYL